MSTEHTSPTAPPSSGAGKTSSYEVPGLTAPVEILLDPWGVPHLYASSAGDLFRAQGFNAARDRLFQLDLWRRRGLGLLSEVFGPDYVEHDRAARLFLYRGDMAEEWQAYGEGVEEAAHAFVDGINAYVDLCHTGEAEPPPEFGLLGYEPAHWNPSDIARIRSHGLQYNLRDEVARALTLRDHGPAAEDLRRRREPAPHTLQVPEGLDLTVIPDDVLHVYDLATTPPWSTAAPRQGLDGSNNWVLDPTRTATGRPILANDPHRAITLPSLRYLAHLSAPGIDVIGAGEPALPGLSIGHNGHLAFGLTIFPIDQEDLYVYETAPDDPYAYRYGNGWERMTCVVERIPVRGTAPADTELWFTRHGPVIRQLPDQNAAFAVRAAWLGPGMAPYLGSMDYMRAKDPDAFLTALRRWGAPGENQVYAAPDGTVGWRPAGRVPVRPGWDGTLPVPGDGRYEWDGFLDLDELPSQHAPEQGWFATANQLNLPPDHDNDRHTVTYDWYAPTRYDRIAEELSARDDWTVADCVRLQTDTVSLPARAIVGLLGEETQPADAVRLLRNWDCRLAADSAAAALFEVWYRRHLRPALYAKAFGGPVPTRVLPVDDPSADARVDLELLDRGLATPDLLTDTLRAAHADCARRLGPDPATWTWGALHRAHLVHPAAALLGDDARSTAPDWTEIGPAARGGSGDTVGAAAYGGDFRQTAGASFRLVVDVGAWDESVAMNSPGQSGNPAGAHYSDLFEEWAADGSFPLLYSRQLVEKHAQSTITLRPTSS
ncbi:MULTISPECIES: penicillin acylase family protein [unclassified Streptomyces]|uniref:penicillin acylase family protein n=1 Tax=unclassified Streptomyces TaxID=2593676 RepID=UPI00278BD4D4|nr:MULTISPECIES: penicillin acylase family protein [unclassified Streptomyces]